MFLWGLLLLLWCSISFAGEGKAATELKGFEGKRIAVATGSVFDKLVQERFPDAEIVYLNLAADFIASLESGKIDAFAADEPGAWLFCMENDRLAIAEGYLDTCSFGFVMGILFPSIRS